ncbi:uncharacterized protein LOC110177862 [Drosophila serrata]|uniref:uncharacterized protein LOC110177862 n=1 Tax=Drosophila serrata TaxID=7274 RepID=UPI000A1CF4CB|nr:uncharacterized protein LOC110177862 [Drosophila serrata]
MESKNCKFFGPNGGDCHDKSVGAIFYDFVTKNMAMPSEMGELVAYVLLMVISWYVVAFTFRFMLSLVKPVLIVLVALFLFRFLRTFEGGEMKDVLIGIANLLMSGVSKAAELFMRLLD